MTDAKGSGFPPEEATDLILEEVTFQGPGSELGGFYARPGGEGRHPGVLLIHDRNGDDPHNRDMTRRLASAGYGVLLLDLYSRAGGTAQAAASGKPPYEAAPIQPEEGLADLAAGLDWLRTRENVKPEALGTVGFCMGGRYALLLAERRPDLKAAVVYYGVLSAQGSIDPLADVEKIQAATLGHFGDEDPIIPLDQVRELDANLKETPVSSAVYTYPGAGHAFSNDRNPRSYHPEAAALAWKRTVEWFGTELSQ